MECHESLYGLIRKAANESSNGIIYINSGESESFVSYTELYKNAQGILSYLKSKNVKPGEEVIILLEDNSKFLDCFWGCIIGGIIPVPVSSGNSPAHKSKLLCIWKTLNSPYIITSNKVVADFGDYLRKQGQADFFDRMKHRIFNIDIIEHRSSGCNEVFEAKSSDIAFIQFSSGSTGDPKGVVLTHENLLTNINAIIKGSNCTKDDSSLSWMPLTHDMGLIGFHLVPLAANINQYIMPTSLFIRNPVIWLKKAQEHKITVLASPNFGYKYFLDYFKHDKAKDWDLSHIRLIFNGAEPISVSVCQKFLSALAPYNLKSNVMFNVYGLAEASLAVSFPLPGKALACVNLSRDKLSIGDTVAIIDSEESAKFVDLGYCVNDCSIRVCDHEERELADNTVGYIHIKGKNVTCGYYNNRLETLNVFTKDGWLNTGDLGFITDKRLIVTGRAKDIIFINGQNYYPHDIERVAEGVSGIELGKVVACGSLNPLDQKEDIVIFVYFKKRIEEFIPMAVALKRHINSQMGLNIKLVLPVKEIPKTTSGKVQRYKLAEMYNRGEFSDLVSEIENLALAGKENMEFPKPKSDIEEQLIKIWRELLNINNISTSDNFFEVGGNSMLLIQMHSKLDSLYPNKISVTDIVAYPTISKLAEFIENDSSSKAKRLSLDSVKLPDNYFYGNCQGSISKGYSYKFQICGELFDSLLKIVDLEKIGVEKILVSLFAYLFAEVSQEQEITVQAMVENEEDVISLHVDFREINSITELFKRIHKCLIEKKSAEYKLKNIFKISVKKDDFHVIPIFYAQSLLKEKVNLCKAYDIALGFSQNDKGLAFEIEYDSDRLRDEGIEDLISSYMKIIDGVVKSTEAESLEAYSNG